MANQPALLTDAELDAVAAGQSLVSVDVHNVLNNNTVQFLNNNNVQVGAGVAVAVLGAAAAGATNNMTPA